MKVNIIPLILAVIFGLGTTMGIVASVYFAIQKYFDVIWLPIILALVFFCATFLFACLSCPDKPAELIKNE